MSGTKQKDSQYLVKGQRKTGRWAGINEVKKKKEEERERGREGEKRDSGPCVRENKPKAQGGCGMAQQDQMLSLTPRTLAW